MARGDKFEKHFERKREDQERYRKTLPTEDEKPLPPPVDPIVNEKSEPGRNDPCPCGSGKKYKQCCITKARKKR
jgi:uncharacterized protein YecA (UPF0149 family)